MVSTLCTGLSFTEGPVWAAGLGKLFFSNYDAQDYMHGFPGGILQYSPGAACAEFAPEAGTNGLALGTDGKLVAARHVTKTVAAIDPVQGTVVNVISDYMGTSFNSPNDITVRKDGTLLFTDPAWSPVALPHSVYSRTPAGEIRVVELDGRRPNGITLSRDQDVVYVSVESPRETLAFDLADDGSLLNARQFVADGSDGMTLDCAGNLYLTGAGSVRIYAPDGAALGTIPVPGATGPDPTNVAFGGADRTTLYITGGGSLRAVQLNIPGFPY
jgi:gluconolactonase